MSSLVAHDLHRFGPDAQCDVSPLHAAAYVRRLALHHRENFHVITRLVPAPLVDDFCSVYGFCRWADDLSDEAGSPARATSLLHWWSGELDACFAGRASHPVLIALRDTIERRRLPIQPFQELMSAFLQDQQKLSYDSWDELLDYCSRSAAPVGRLVLTLFDERSAACHAPSDATCAALQLVNLWQDVRRDLVDRGRVYIPRDVAAQHGLSLESLRDAVARPADGEPPVAGSHFDRTYRAALRDLCNRTSALFAQGRPLLRIVKPEARPVLKLFSLGGEAVLRAVERAGHRTYARRPRIGRLTRAWLFGRVWVAHKVGFA